MKILSLAFAAICFLTAGMILYLSVFENLQFNLHPGDVAFCSGLFAIVAGVLFLLMYEYDKLKEEKNYRR